MGSQNVTDFSAARKKAIQQRLRAYDPKFDPTSRVAADSAAAAVAAAIKSLAPKTEYGQALTSKSVAVAAKTLADLAAAAQAVAESKGPGDAVLGAYGVAGAEQHPLTSLIAGLRRKFNEDLAASSRKTEAASAAVDALGATVLDVISGAYPTRKEPAEVTRSELLGALGRTPASVFSEVFVEHLLRSMVRQTFDAARGRTPPEHIDALMKAAEPRINDLAVALTRRGGRF